MPAQQITTPKRQALLLFIQGVYKGKSLGFGRQLDQSIQLAMIYRTYDLLQRIQQVDIVIVQDGEAPPLEGAVYLPQRGIDLKDCFVTALQDTFALGYERVVAVGGDIPTLHSDDIQKALFSDEVVIGPSCDGGFYLAGMEKEDVRFFDNLPWRQSHLFSHLQGRLADCGRCYSQLQRRRDIDHAGDGRKNASLLINLVRFWVKFYKSIHSQSAGRGQFFADRIPEPRYSSLPPPVC
ncbi:DUF2064 domain-containing protein [uncultured Desulfuromusa sp.]|uniref:TIGR04282 family arsenosugar biosynthesis glycosyltransferase n=1 Tax=uncultured Desulfuromusa sp. TaxID=219183 RepID=UPI002AA744CB|nr:DUF2064 domain-containing protein [uncultured Desulfuromusa sp.]